MEELLIRAKKNYKSKFELHGSEFREMLLHKLDSWADSLGLNTTLQPFQVQAVEKTRNLFADANNGNKPVLIVAPIGSGKSLMIVMLPYFLNSKKVMVITHSEDASREIADLFNIRPDKQISFLHKIGFSGDQDGITAFFEPVTVIETALQPLQNTTALGNLVIVNAQKFGGNARSSLKHEYKETNIGIQEFFTQFDTLIVDEAHHYPAPTWKRIVDECKKAETTERKKIIFLTATPYRNDKKGRPIPILPESEDRIVTIRKEDCLGKTIRAKPDFHEYSDESSFARDIISILRRQQESEPRFTHQAMVLAKDRNHNDEIVKALNRESKNKKFAVGIKNYTDGALQLFTEPPEGAFKEGAYRVAVVCKIAVEGYDNSNVSVCVILRKVVTARILLSQFVGRCLRIKRNLPPLNQEDIQDRTIPQILTYKQYNIRRLYEEIYKVAETDPDDDTESDSDDDGDANFEVSTSKRRKVK